MIVCWLLQERNNRSIMCVTTNHSVKQVAYNSTICWGLTSQLINKLISMIGTSLKWVSAWWKHHQPCHDGHNQLFNWSVCESLCQLEVYILNRLNQHQPLHWINTWTRSQPRSQPVSASLRLGCKHSQQRISVWVIERKKGAHQCTPSDHKKRMHFFNHTVWSPSLLSLSTTNNSHEFWQSITAKFDHNQSSYCGLV